MFLARGDTDLGVAFQTQPGSQASSRVEAKTSILLCSTDGYLLEPTEWPKGTTPPVEFGEVSGHRVLIKRGPGNRGASPRGSTHEATSGMSS